MPLKKNRCKIACVEVLESCWIPIGTQIWAYSLVATKHSLLWNEWSQKKNKDTLFPQSFYVPEFIRLIMLSDRRNQTVKEVNVFLGRIQGKTRGFPGALVARLQCFQHCGLGQTPSQGNPLLPQKAETKTKLNN